MVGWAIVVVVGAVVVLELAVEVVCGSVVDVLDDVVEVDVGSSNMHGPI